MRLAHWLWISGFIVAPVGGWWTAKLSNADRPQAYVAQRPVEAAGLLVLSQQPAATPPATTTETESDDVAGSKADLTRLLSAMGAANVDAAIESHSKLEAQLIEQQSARDNATAALAEVGAKNVGEAISQIRDLNQRLSDQKSSNDSQTPLAEQVASQDAQGWQCQYVPVCPAPTAIQAPVAVAPADCALEIVYCP